MNLISLEEWNKTNMVKLLWNLNGKAHSLWIKWIHSYYIKNDQQNCSWILKITLNQRDTVQQMQWWSNMSNKFETKRVYRYLKEVCQIVEWRKTLYSNMASPRAIFMFWLAYHNRLATKERDIEVESILPILRFLSIEGI